MIIRQISKLFERLGTFFISIHLGMKNSYKKSRKQTNERSIEYGFVLECLSRNQVVTVLDIGSGKNAFPAVLEHCGYDITASDLKGSYWKSYSNRHINVTTDDITKTNFLPDSFDAITCISALEHIDDYDEAVINMANILHPGGILILSFPYTYDAFCDNVYSLDGADPKSKYFRYKAHSFSDTEISRWQEYGLTLENQRYYKGWGGKYWRTGERLASPVVVTLKEEANGICLLFRKAG